MFKPEDLSATYVVAYSGGVDSHVLLHILANIEELNVKAIHINHGLSPNAYQWSQHCKATCDALNVPLHIIEVNATPKKGESGEAAARNARYAAFKQVLAKDEYLVTAHHQDDQAETLLLQLARGAGPKGLAAMPAITTFQEGFLLRPLLDFTRAQLVDYANLHTLTWVEDESNQDITLQRNFVRHKLLPFMANHWPAIKTTLARSASHCADGISILEEIAKEDLQKANGTQPNTLSITQLNKLTKARKNNLIRYWLQQLNLPLPNTKRLQSIEETMLHASPGSQPLVSWEGAQLRRYQENLYAMPPLTPFDSTQVLPWDLTTPITLPNNLGTLYPKDINIPKAQQNKPITIRFRQLGEGNKKHYQKKQIPPWLRDRSPLVYAGGELVDFPCVYG